MKTSKQFTLIEVVVAIAILGMGLITALSITTTVSRRMNKALARWEHRHILAQALEYYLLAGAKADLPEEIFPYKNYTVDCEVDEVEDLPEGVPVTVNRWKLAVITVTLHDEYGKELETIKIEKILRRDD